MYLRQTKRSNKDGSDAMYFQIAENVWSKANKRSEVKVLHNFGRVDPESEQRLRKLAESILDRLRKPKHSAPLERALFRTVDG